jgi:cytochrome P450
MTNDDGRDAPPEAPVQFTPWDPATQRDPYPQLRDLQRRDPVHWFDLVSGWVVTSYADVAAVLADDRLSSRVDLSTFERDRAVSFGGPELDRVVDAFFANSLLFLDDPAHGRLRRLLRPFFSRDGIAALDDRIQLLVDETLDALPDEGEVELVSAFTSRLPALVAGEVLGVPRVAQERLRRCAEGIGVFFDIVKSDDERAHAARCLADLWRLFDDLASSTGDGSEGLVQALARLCERGLLTRDELLATCCLLSSAGHESTGNLLANAMLALVAAPELARSLAAEPERIGAFVEEVLRTDGPVVGVQRVATAEIPLHGRVIRPGDYVIAITAAANRDPAEFADPDRLDPHAARAHLAFGHGRHVCIGARLARAEATIAIARWLDTFEFSLARPAEVVPRKPTQVLRGPAALWVRVRRRARAATAG